MRCGSLRAAVLTLQWKVGERYSARRYRREEGEATVLALPAVGAETALHPKTTASSGELALSSFSH